MPYGDGTGPFGTGPVGRGRGGCRGFGGLNAGVTRFGFGRGFRNIAQRTGLPFWARQQNNFSQQEEKEFLNGELNILENQMNNIKSRLSEIDTNTNKEAEK